MKSAYLIAIAVMAYSATAAFFVTQLAARYPTF